MEPLVAIGVAAVAALAMYAFHRAEIQRLKAEQEIKIAELTAKAADDAVNQSRATLKGQLGERFAPLTKGFGYAPADARFLGSPVDYVVFDGMSDGEIKGVVLVEVKVGHLPLTPFQRQVKEAIKAGRIEWRTQQLDDPTSTDTST